MVRLICLRTANLLDIIKRIKESRDITEHDLKGRSLLSFPVEEHNEFKRIITNFTENSKAFKDMKAGAKKGFAESLDNCIRDLYGQPYGMKLE